MRTSLTRRLVGSLIALMGAACAPEVGGVPTGPLAALQQEQDDESPRYSDWSAPVNLGPAVNSKLADMNPAASKGGRSLYFARGGSPGTFDIWVSQRADANDPWGPAQDVGPAVNSDGGDNSPALSPDGHRLFFNSTRPGGFGGQDLCVARRRDKRDDFGWSAPVNLGRAVNTGANEVQMALVEHDATGRITLYFASNRPGGLGDNDIYASTIFPDGTLGPPVLVAELSTSADDTPGDIRPDGLEMFIASDRPGTLGGQDLWVAVRASPAEPWSTPVNLGPVINTTFNEGGAALSHDGTTLYFHSTANLPGATGPCFGDLGPCVFDVYVTTRSKLDRDP